MNLKKTAALAFLAGALLLYVFYFEIPRGERKLEKEKLFANLSRDRIESIAIQNKSGSFTLVNSEPVKQAADSQDKETGAEPARLAKWQLGDLQGADIDRGTLNTLLASLVDLRIYDPIPDPDAEKDPAVYGLSSPEITLTLKDPDGSTEIRLGKKNEYLQKRYLSASGRSGIYLVPEALYTAAGKSRTDFRNKGPIEFSDGDLSEIILQSGEQRIRVKSAEQGKWQIAEPLDAPASPTAISSLTMNLRNLRAVDFEDDLAGKFSQYHFDRPDYRVQLAFKDESRRSGLDLALSIVAGEKPEDSVAFMLVQGKPSLYKLGSNPAGSIFKPVDELREKKFLQFDADQVVRLDAQIEGAGTLSLLKTGDKWNVNGKEADAVFVRELLNGISQLEAAAFPGETGDFGFDAPRLRADIHFAADKDGKEPAGRSLVIGKAVPADTEEEKTYFAGVDDLKMPFIISQKTLDRITPREESLLKTQATPEPLKAESTGADPASGGAAE